MHRRGGRVPPRRSLMRPRFPSLPSAKAATVLAAAFLAAGSIVQASIRGQQHHPRADPPRARFEIGGRVAAPLAPGETRPVEVTLTNLIHHALWISDLKLSVTIDTAHERAGCTVARDYVVTQLPRSVYPIRLPGRPRRRGARDLRLPDLRVLLTPTISMPNLPDVDQDGCKGARLWLHFWASSRLHPQYVWVRPAPAQVR